MNLRVMVAAACLAGYFATRPEPLWTVVGWNIFFLLLNAWQVGRLLLPRLPEGAPNAPV